MTEVFSECEDLVNLIRERRPEWLREEPDLAAFHRLRADWAGGRGFWSRARQNPDQEAGFVMTLGDERLERARREAHDRRERMSHLAYDSVSLKGWSTAIPRPEPGWGAREVEAWRVFGATSWWTYLVAQPSQPYLDWLGPFVDLPRLAQERASWNHLWGQEVEARELPREWMRWAVGWLQGLRRVTAGTPGDNQIALYTYDADVFLTADRTFADILGKVRREAPAPVAVPHRVRTGPDGLEEMLTLIEQCQ